MNTKCFYDLNQLIEKRSEALVERDIEFFSSCVTEDFIYTNASGKLFDKTSYIDFFIKSGEMKWQSQELDEIQIRHYGETAIMTCQIYDKASYNGNDFEGYFRSTQVFVKQNGRWLYAAGQTTTMAS